MQSINKTKELLRKFNLFSHYKNVNELPNNLETVTLFITMSKNMSLKNIVKAFALLELITGSRPFFVRSKKSSVLLKRRKGAPIGVKLTLRGDVARLFLLKLVWEILPKIKDLNLNYNLKRDSNQSSVLLFKIKDPFVFSELKNFYFLFKDAGSLKVVCSFKKNNSKGETYFKSRLLQLPFK